MKKTQKLQSKILKIFALITFVTAFFIFAGNTMVVYNNINQTVRNNSAQTVQIGKERIESLINKIEQIHLNSNHDYELLKANVQRNKVISHTFLLNSNREVIESYPENIDLKKVFEENNIDIFNRFEISWSNSVYIDELEGKYLILAAPELLNNNWEISLIDLEQLNLELKELQFKDNFKLNIYDQNRNLIVGDDYQADTKEFVKKETESIEIDTELAEEVNSVYFENGGGILSALLPLYEQNWLVESSIAKSLAYKPFNDSFKTTVMLSIFIFLLIILLSNLSLKRVLNPIKHFANQIIKVRKGCYDKIEIRRSSIAELNFIQSKFQEMVKLIKKRENDLTEMSEELKGQNKSLIETQAELDKQLEKGCKLHRRFLPDEEIKLRELNIESYHQPSKILGGDFFNFIENDSYLIMYLADVRGHGLDGAFLNISIREKINSYLYQHRQEKISPAKILNFVHVSIKNEDIPDDYFVAMMIIVYDKNKEEFILSNAGIQFPLLIKRKTKIEEIMIKEMPISKIIPAENYDFKEKSFKLNKGEYLFLTTDGLIEEKREGSHYGWSRLKTIISENDSGLKKIILDDFNSFIKNKRAVDDVTFMLIKYNL